MSVSPESLRRVEPGTSAVPFRERGIKAATGGEQLIHRCNTMGAVAKVQAIRTGVVPVTLSGADYLGSTMSAKAQLCFGTKLQTGHVGSGKMASARIITTSSRISHPSLAKRPPHGHTSEIVAHDLREVIRASSTNRKIGKS